MFISWHIFIPHNIWWWWWWWGGGWWWWWGGGGGGGNYIMTLHFHSWQHLVRGWLHRSIIFSVPTIFGEGVTISWCYIFTPGNGQVRLGVQYVTIFLYIKFWIRLGTVSYRGKKVQTVDSSAVRSVDKSRNTRNCVQKEPKYAICVHIATRLYYKALGIILCALI